MSGPDPHQVGVGDVIRLRRAHPCGNDRMVVTVLGADVRMTCQGCAAKVMVDRHRLRSRIVEVVGRVGEGSRARGPGR